MKKTTTFERQKELPTLPIPELVDTCNKYLTWLNPIRDKDELAKTRKVIENFLKSI